MERRGRRGLTVALGGLALAGGITTWTLAFADSGGSQNPASGSPGFPGNDKTVAHNPDDTFTICGQQYKYKDLYVDQNGDVEAASGGNSCRPLNKAEVEHLQQMENTPEGRNGAPGPRVCLL